MKSNVLKEQYLIYLPKEYNNIISLSYYIDRSQHYIKIIEYRKTKTASMVLDIKQLLRVLRYI